MRKFLQLSLFCMLSSSIIANAQTGKAVTGIVKDSAGASLPGATIKLTEDNGDSLFTPARADGSFFFKLVTTPRITLTISANGFVTLVRHYKLKSDSTIVSLGVIQLGAQFNTLNPVTVVAANPVMIKEDTVTYNVNAFKVRQNAPLEDALKKMPGVDVDINGNVTAQGKQVTKVRVNGKDFFGGDVKTATRNLPADIVENVQMIDDYGDQANLTGVKTGEPDKIMNITIRPDRNHGYTGQVTAGDGADAAPEKPGISNDNRYIGLVNAFKFNGNQQFALLGNINNTNVNTFSFGTPATSDPITTKKLNLDAAMSGKGNVGGGNFTSQAATQNGITNAHAAGFNYRDQWSKAVSIYGSYSFSDNTVVTKSVTVQQNTLLSNPGFVNENSNETNRNINHRLNWNLEYKPDTINYLKVTPAFSYSGVTTNALQDVNQHQKDNITEYTSNLYGTLYSPNYGITALYNHRFSRQGRNLSINVTANSVTTRQYQNPVFSYITGTLSAPSVQMINTYSHSTNYGITLSYLEPLGEFKYLEFNYAFNRSITNNDKQTTVPDSLNHSVTIDSALSNRYNYTFTTNRFGLNYRYVKKVFNYTIGIGVEPSTLHGNSPLLTLQTHASAINIIPIGHLVFNFQRNKTLSLNYSGFSSQPSFNQLQPVIDFSNALYPVQGNPNLQPQFTNNFSVRYNKFDFATGNTLFTNLSFSQIQNQVVSNTISYPHKYLPNPALQNTYLTQYKNANGFYTASAFASFAKPWHNRRYTLILNGSVTYNNNIGYLTSIDSLTYTQTTLKNTAKNIIFTPTVRFRVDIPDVIDAQILAGYAISKTNNSINNNFTNISANIRTLTFGISGKIYFFKDWTFSYEYSKNINYGYTVQVTNPNFLDLYVERRFLKNNKATLRFAAFDVFNQNTGYSTAITASTITETSVSRLGRYYLLSFTYRFQKFGGK